ncbi:hypothetical protein [Pseudoalteromonas simplex]|uniref:hypothetical protein n=1 Tax=Pseudoalteromonas simplex TaxID=2783613 RepID=UPI001886BCAA|nr:hypothetical protein [Pseudoalteromonas sp. A520]
MSEFLELTGDLKQSVEQLNQVLQGDENTSVEINGVQKPSITKLIIDTLNSIVQLVTDAAADIDAVKYETTSAGIAATSSGQYFSVVSDDDTAFLKLYKNDGGIATFKKAYPNDKALDALYSTIVDEFFVNYVTGGDFIDGNPELRSNSTVVDLDNQLELIERGYRKGIKWKSGNDFARAHTGVDLNNLYIAGCLLIYSENPANLPNGGNVIYSETESGSIAVTNSRSNGFIQLTPRLILAYEYGQVSQVGATNILVGSSSVPVDDTRFATGFFATYQENPFDVKALLAQFLIKDKCRLDNYKVSQSQGFANSNDVEQALQAYEADALPTALSNNLKQSFSNEFVEGDFTASIPRIRSGSKVVSLKSFDDFKARGLSKGVNLRSGGNEFVFTEEQENLNGKYVLGAFYLHSQDEEFPEAAFVYSADSNDTLKALKNTDHTYLQITPKFKLFLYKGLVDDANVKKLVIGSSYQPEGEDLFAGGYYFISSMSDISFSEAINNIFITDKCRHQIVNNLLSTKPNFVLNGEDEDSYLIGYQGNDEVKRVIRPFPNLSDLSQVKVFNFNGDYINGQVVKMGNDDVAPQRVMDTTVGANHGYKMGLYSSVNHGKKDADIGSVYELGSEQYVILGLVDANTLWIAHRFNNSTAALGDGVFNHLSGGVNTSSFTATYQSYADFRPAFQNRNMIVLVDGKKVDQGSYEFKESIKFIESYDVLSREEIIQWYIEDRESNEVSPSGREPSYSVSMVYEFDKYANCTIYSDIVFLKELNVQDLMFLQAMRLELDRYYIPKAVSFNSQGVDFDYALIEPANKTSSNGLNSVYIDAAKMEAGKIVDRFIGLNDNSASVFAMGYLPIKSALPETRMVNTSEKAWEIRGNTDKMYPRVVDKGDFVASIGEYYSVIGYRNVFKRPGDSTASYPVKSSAGDYYFLDWHDVMLTQRVNLPSEYHGREIDVVEKSDNVTLHSKMVTDSLLVSVDCLGSYGYLVMVAR